MKCSPVATKRRDIPFASIARLRNTYTHNTYIVLLDGGLCVTLVCANAKYSRPSDALTQQRKLFQKYRRVPKLRLSSPCRVSVSVAVRRVRERCEGPHTTKGSSAKRNGRDGSQLRANSVRGVVGSMRVHVNARTIHGRVL